MDSVSIIKKNGKCCACGICAAVCPVEAIKMDVAGNGEIQPVISEKCVHCGKCLTVCAGNTEKDKIDRQEQNISCKTVASKDEGIRRNATSGGFVTTLVAKLLEAGLYDGAFLVAKENYQGVVQTVLCSAGSELAHTQKSRYIQVTHSNEVAHIIANPQKRYILVGTPCYFRGFLKMVKEHHLNRENYLLVGLFCDKTMTTHVWEYFNRYFANGQLDRMYFRSKGNAGWPGDVLLFQKDGIQTEVSRRERMDVKEYFMAQSCLSCMDKLNPYADFAVGDNYVSGQRGEAGWNSVIIRTQKAAQLYDMLKDVFYEEEVSFEQIVKSQKIDKRAADLEKNRSSRLKKMELGAAGEYENIRKEVMTNRKRNRNPLRRIFAKCKKMCKR